LEISLNSCGGCYSGGQNGFLRLFSNFQTLSFALTDSSRFLWHDSGLKPLTGGLSIMAARSFSSKQVELTATWAALTIATTIVSGFCVACFLYGTNKPCFPVFLGVRAVALTMM
jgi:hypothetical protein